MAEALSDLLELATLPRRRWAFGRGERHDTTECLSRFRHSDRNNARLEPDGPELDARVERFLKVEERAADNHNMGHTPLLQERVGS
jgi:hypothetical protein